MFKTVHIDAIRFWLLLFPSLSAYLLTDRNVKIIFIIPFIWVGIDFFRTKLEFKVAEKDVLRAMAIYFVIVSISLLSSLTQGDQRILFRDILIIVSPLFLFLNPIEIPKNPGTILYVCFSSVYIATTIQKFGSNFGTDRFNPRNIFLPSEVIVENNFGVIFGLFTLHFLISRKWIWFGSSAVFSILASKRALVAGVLVAVGYWLLHRKKKNGITKWDSAKIFLLYALLGVSAVFLVEIGQQVIEMSGLSDMKLSRFLMGRDRLLLDLRENALDFSIAGIFGHGPGTADTYLAFRGSGWGGVFLDTPFNPHNDHMKVLYDYGYVGYFLFFFFLYNFYGATRKGAVLLVYTITVFCFDNSLIFIVYQVVAGFLCLEYRKEERCKLIT